MYALKIDGTLYTLSGIRVLPLTIRTFYGELSPRELKESLLVEQLERLDRKVQFYIDVDDMVSRGIRAPVLVCDNLDELPIYASHLFVLTGASDL